MIRVLIVEDEPPIARVVKQRIEQFSEQFVVAGTAINGQAALEQLADGQIDVVFTDIRMPVMDGIALLQQIQALYPHVITVILSGYQEFSYAQSALRYGAYDYLLKPISKGKIEDILARLEIICCNRVNEKKRAQLLGAIRGDNPQKVNYPDCIVMFFVAGAFSPLADDALIPGSTFWERVNLEQVILPLLTGKESLLVFDGKLRCEKIAIIEHLNSSRAREVAQEIFARLTTREQLHITLLGFPDPVPFSMVGTAINELRLNQYKTVKLCKSQLVWEDPKASKTVEKAFVLSDFPANKIVEAIYTQDLEKLSAAVTESLLIAEHNELTQLEFQQFLDLIINDNRLVTDQFAPFISYTRADILAAVTNAVTLHELGEEMVSVFTSLSQSTGLDSQKEREDIVQEIEQFLIANYGKSISNEMLASKFGFVPSYIRKIFRKSKGVTPSEYLTSYRIEMAKQIIREQPSMRIRDIAQLVGYDDQYYFSKIFKKETGIWPKQYHDECLVPGRN